MQENSQVGKVNKPSQDDVLYALSLGEKSVKIINLYKKIEGISGAIFLVTNQIKDSEISKRHLREVSLISLKTAGDMVSTDFLELAQVHSLKASLLNLNSLLDISFWAGLISQMNASIIQKEVILMLDVIKDLEKDISGNNDIKSKFFKEDPIKDNIRDIIKDVIKDTQKDKVNVPNKKLDKPTSIDKIDRRKKILDILKTSSNKNIRDISAVFGGVSEKTIQRELLYLIGQGLIKRAGDRRWSTYSLA